MRLPISGFGVSFRHPGGRDELAILEGSGDTPGRAGTNGDAQAAVLESAVNALSRLAEITSGRVASEDVANSVSPTLSSAPWIRLTVTDFEAALLGLRRFLFGDIVLSVIRCSCAERMEIELSITRLLNEIKPRIPHRVEPSASRPGWFEFHAMQQVHKRTGSHAGNPLHVSFRLPTVSDQLPALRSPDPYAFLKERCIEISAPSHRIPLAIERAMETMSPAVSRSIQGNCAACGATLSAQLHVPSLVLHELRASAVHIYREVHAIAAFYHWDESAILDIPQLRRQAYADAIRQGVTR